MTSCRPLQSFLHSAFVSILLCAASGSVAGEVKLSVKDVNLKVVGDAELGTLDKGVGLAAGAKVTDFSTKTYEGETVSFAQLRAQAPLLVIFYRGGWCAYCNVQVRQMSQASAEFTGRGVTPVLISADKPDAASLAQKSYEIPFPVLSDADLHAHRAFNVVLEVAPEKVAKYQKYGIDLQQWSGRDHGAHAVASAFLLNDQGVVLWSHASHQYDTRPSIQQLLHVIDRLHSE